MLPSRRRDRSKRISDTILDEFREGRIGAITLEKPVWNETEVQNGEQVKGMHTAEDRVPMTGKQRQKLKHRLRHEKEMRSASMKCTPMKGGIQQGFGIVGHRWPAGTAGRAVVAAWRHTAQYCLVEG